MKFTKLAKSDKFEYMMLSRLIQDAKYFIDYPDLKHLWARTLDEHIKQMREQYNKLDPKPEWITMEQIDDLAKQMKESYQNHWDEVHPDNKIEAAIQQPNKPKPTTTLPTNMEWSWDPEAADWVAVMKDNTNVTPPLYNPQNQNVVNQNTNTYMSTVKSANKSLSVLPKLLDKCWHEHNDDIRDYVQLGDWEIGLGGYDTGYEIHYKGTPLFSITSDNELKPFMSDEMLQEDFGFTYSDIENVLKTHRDLEDIKMVNSSKKYAGEEIDKLNLSRAYTDSSYALKLLRDGIVTRDSRHYDALIESCLDGCENDDSSIPSILIELGLIEEGDRYYDRAIKQTLKHPTYCYYLLQNGAITKDSEYYVDVLNSAIRYDDNAKNLIDKGEVEKEYVDTLDKNRFNTYKNALIDIIKVMKTHHLPVYSSLEKALEESDERKNDYVLRGWLLDAIEYLENEGYGEEAIKFRKVLNASKKVKSSYLSRYLVNEALDIRKKLLGDNKEYSPKMVIFTLNDEQDKIINTTVIDKESASSYPVKANDYFLFMDTDSGWELDDYNLHPTYQLNRYYGNDKKSASVKCLSEFLDGPRFSKEIKIEAGLIKEGLVKYAGFDFNRGTKYEITEKGLKVLREASEKEHNEALNEREKLAYLFGFNTDKDTTLDTTGKVIKSEKRFHIHLPGNFYTQEIYGNTLEEALENYGYKLQDIVEWYDDEGNGEYVGDISNVKEGSFKKQFSIYEADGCELGKVTASSQLDALVKFGIEHPEYADSQSISAKQVCADENSVETTYVSVKELKSFLRQNGAKEVNFGTFVSDIQPSGLVKKMVAHGTKKIRLTYDEYKLDVYTNGARLIENLAVYDGNWKDKYYKFSNPIGVKLVDSKYEETTEKHLDYPNPSETPTKGVTLENHDGWVNTASEDSSTNGKLVVKSKNNIEKGDILVLDDLFYVMNVEHNGEDYLRDEDRNRLAVCTLKEVHGPMKITQFIPLNKLPDNVNVLEGYSFHNK